MQTYTFYEFALIFSKPYSPYRKPHRPATRGPPPLSEEV